MKAADIIHSKSGTYAGTIPRKSNDEQAAGKPISKICICVFGANIHGFEIGGFAKLMLAHAKYTNKL